MNDILAIIIGGIFVNNVIFIKFMGLCPYIGVSKRIDTAVGMSLGVLFVITLASTITFFINYAVLVPFNIEFMRTVTFILVIAALVQMVELVVRKLSSTLYNALGIYLPLITTNCAVLGVALLAIKNDYNFWQMLAYAVSSSLGFGLALIIFAGIRTKLDSADIPLPFRGVPIALIVASILAMAFMGFSNMVK